MSKQKERLMTSLREAAEEASEANWDGYSCKPVSKRAVVSARAFCRMFPNTKIEPSVGCDPAGYLSVEWHANKAITLSVSIRPVGSCHKCDLIYAALIGKNNEHYGSIRIEEYDLVPWIILRLIEMVDQ